MSRARNRLAAAVSAALLLNAAPAVAKQGVKAVEAGPIKSNWDAQSKCPEVARKAGGTWTGDWRTRNPLMSECDVKFSSGGSRDPKVKAFDAGPIMNNWDAQNKCPAVAKKAGGTWTGDWRTTGPMRSECDVKMDSASWSGGHKVKAVEAGPIMSNWDAQRKCPEVAKQAGGTWTGDWRTTRPGMSECDVRK